MAASVVVLAWLVRTPVTDAELDQGAEAGDRPTGMASPMATPTPTAAPRPSADLEDLPVADGSWTAIPLADALSEALAPPSTRMVGQDLVVLDGREVHALDTTTLTWRGLPDLPSAGPAIPRTIVDVGGALVVLRSTSSGVGEVFLDGLLLDDGGAGWLPIPPLPPGLRTFATIGPHLVVIGAPDPDGTTPAHRLQVADGATWEALPAIPVAVGAGRLVDADGIAHLVAVGAGGDAPISTQLLRLADGTWEVLAAPPAEVADATGLAWLPEPDATGGRLVAAGSAFPPSQGPVLLATYDASTDRWATADVGAAAGGIAQAVPDGDGRLHLSRAGDEVGDVLLLDVTTQTVAVLPPPVVWQGPPTLHPLADGSLLAAGPTPDTALAIRRWTPEDT